MMKPSIFYHLDHKFIYKKRIVQFIVKTKQKTALVYLGFSTGGQLYYYYFLFSRVIHQKYIYMYNNICRQIKGDNSNELFILSNKTTFIYYITFIRITFIIKRKKKVWLSTVRNFMSTDLTWQNYFKVSNKTFQHW